MDEHKIDHIYFNPEINMQNEIWLHYFGQEFIKINVPDFAEFTNWKLDSVCHLIEYFHKKLKCIRKLCLDENLILQGLTGGLKSEHRNILMVNSLSVSVDSKEFRL